MLGVAAACLISFLFARLLLRRERGDLIAVTNLGRLSIPLSALWPPPSWLGSHRAQFIPFQRAGRTVIPSISPLTAQRTVYVADAAACKVILNDRNVFVRNSKRYKALQLFGDNVLGTDGDDWVRHRSIARKSFGENTNALVWVETVRILDEWFAQWDAEIVAGRQTATDVTDTLRHMTLCIIASAGFGVYFSRERRAGFRMTFAHALFAAIETTFLRIFTPRVLYALPIPALRMCDAAFEELERYIHQMIAETRAGQIQTVSESDRDAEAAGFLKRLIAANDPTAARLTDDELVSNIYVYFLAGHETSAHALTFALALLAIHPEAQKKFYDEAKRVWPDLSGESWNSSTLLDHNRLEYALAVFRETLRLFPPVVRILRYPTNRATLPCEARNSAGQWEPGSISVAPGTPCIVSISAIHMSPLYWGADAAAFRPERFIDTPDWRWPRDAWVPFIGGHHVCLGQRFATVEAVCILARMMRKYRLAPTPEIAKLSRDEQWARLTKWKPGLTTTPGPVKLVLQKRED